jgi:transposase-like protein
MAGHGSKMNRMMGQAVAALLSLRSVEEAAAAIGVNPKTLRRWMKTPEFKDVDRQARHEIHSQLINRQQQIMGVALANIYKTMLDPSVPPSTRLQAAEFIWTQGTKAMELEDLEPRIAELERLATTLKSERKQ